PDIGDERIESTRDTCVIVNGAARCNSSLDEKNWLFHLISALPIRNEKASMFVALVLLRITIVRSSSRKRNKTTFAPMMLPGLCAILYCFPFISMLATQRP